MNESNDWQDLSRQLKASTIRVLSGLIDSGFLVLWVMIQWTVNALIKRFQLSGFDSWMFIIFQILFSISTLIPVIIHMYRETVVMWLRAQGHIRYETKLARITQRISSNDASAHPSTSLRVRPQHEKS